MDRHKLKNNENDNNMKKSDVRDESIENIKQRPFDSEEDPKVRRSKLFRWLRVIFNFITDIFT